MAVLFFVLLLVTPLGGQTFYGSIVGNVTDASNAPIQGAAVTLLNNGTGARQAAQTAASGEYRFVNLVPGQYRVDVEKTGFKHLTRDAVPVEVEAAVRIDLAMQVGDVTQSVEVTASAPLLQTENASLSQRWYETRSVQEMPLNGRNILDLCESCSRRRATGFIGRKSYWQERICSRQLPDRRRDRQSECYVLRRRSGKHYLRQYHCAGSQPGRRSGVPGSDKQ